MDIETDADIDRYTDNLTDTVYGYLLLDHGLRSIPLAALDIEESDLRRIGKLRKRINREAEIFTIQKGGITIRNTALPALKKFIFDQFVRLIAPRDYPKDLTALANTGALGEHIFDRFIAHKSYDADTLRLFDSLTDELYNLHPRTPPAAAYAQLETFFDFVVDNGHAVRSAIGDLLYGRPTTADTLPHPDGIAPLTPAAYAKDNTVILPYLIPLFEFPYLDKITHLTMLYSCR